MLLFVSEKQRLASRRASATLVFVFSPATAPSRSIAGKTKLRASPQCHNAGDRSDGLVTLAQQRCVSPMVPRVHSVATRRVLGVQVDACGRNEELPNDPRHMCRCFLPAELMLSLHCHVVCVHMLRSLETVESACDGH